MANISLIGNTYMNVPYVDLPTTDQTTARFWEESLKFGVLRNDAEVYQTWSKDSLFVQDDGGAIPAYTTTTTTLVASADLSPTSYTLSYANYNYYILLRALTIPIYNTNTKAKGRPEYSVTSALYEIVEYPSGTFKTLDGSISYDYRNAVLNTAGTSYRMLYWTGASAVSLYTSSSYGINQLTSTPSLSSGGVITVKNPSLQIRGYASYLSSSVWDTLTDIRVQYIIELYRAPKDHLNLDGWGIYTQAKHIANCAVSATHKLT